MNGEQIFLLIGELDDALVAAAARPPKRRQPVNAWMLAAAAAVVIGVVGYAGLVRMWQDTLPVQPPAPSTPAAVVTTTTDGTTQNAFTPSSATTTTTTVITTDPSTTLPPTGPDTTTIPSSTVDPTTTGTTTAPLPVTQGTAPDGLPLLNSDGRLVDSSEGSGMSWDVYAYSFEELQVESIASAPAVLPVYVIDREKSDEEAELAAIINRYAALVGDALTEPVCVTNDWGLLNAVGEGEQFSYSLLDYSRNYMIMFLQQPIAVGEPSEWLEQVMAYCPALFADMAEPTLRLSNGERYIDSKGGIFTPQATVSFDAQIYDADSDPDGTAQWLDGISFWVEEGELKCFYIYLEDSYQKVAEYPTLTVEEAIALARRECESLKEDELVNNDYEILSVELLYIPRSLSHLRVPFYRFLVTADESQQTKHMCEQTGTTAFREIYVCAIPQEYWVSPDDMFITQK